MIIGNGLAGHLVKWSVGWRNACYKPAVSTMSQVTKSLYSNRYESGRKEGNSKSGLRNRFTVAWLAWIHCCRDRALPSWSTMRELLDDHRGPWALPSPFFPLATWSLLVIWHSPSRIRFSAKSTVTTEHASSNTPALVSMRRCSRTTLYTTRCFVPALLARLDRSTRSKKFERTKILSTLDTLQHETSKDES